MIIRQENAHSFLNQLNKTNNLVSYEEKNRIDFIGNIISNFCFALSCL